MNKVQVSIIIPVYKVEQYIERCARSLYEQTYDNIEYIWVDDATPDSSIDVLENVVAQYPQRKAATQLVRHDKNKGLPSARRTGLTQARGKYVYHCDSDDWADREMIDVLVACAERENADIVWCDFFRSTAQEDIVVRQDYSYSKIGCLSALLKEKMHGGYWNKLIRRSLYELNEVTFSKEASMCEDLRGTFQLFYYAERVFYCPKAFYHYVQDNQGSMCASFSPKKLSDLLTNIDALLTFLEDKHIGTKLSLEVNCLKHLGKRALLTTTDLNNFRRWRTIYPEANEYILSYTALPLTLRLIGWCAYMKLWLPIRVWICLKKLKNIRG